ncbi:hypothetical protein EN816_00670 [Mesorhizobium sp. M8A.F.Ca.ET.173.01.1.1]|nr:hypothetical protein EN816_00670 [Mesorhizobium sp. M8A.F.Ca.ET.173.01.1.1]
MTAAEQTDWIKWDGGPWDGDPDLIVHVRFADGVESVVAGPAGDIAPNWVRRRGFLGDTSIIAYREA